MSKIGIKEIRLHLNRKSPDALMNELITLIKTFPQVKEYYQAQLLPGDNTEILSKYKKIVENEFFPSRGFGKLRLTNIRKAISDYKKLTPPTEGLVGLLLCFVQQGTEFVNVYGDIQENFYGSMETAYAEACKLVEANNLGDQWMIQLKNIVTVSKNMGYGYGDGISEIFYEMFPHLD